MRIYSYLQIALHRLQIIVSISRWGSPREVTVVEWKALPRQFRTDWLELMFIIAIGLGMGYAARMFAPAISAAIR
jgi:hypothetical protein